VGNAASTIGTGTTGSGVGAAAANPAGATPGSGASAAVRPSGAGASGAAGASGQANAGNSRQQLDAGIPAAVVSGGQTYVLAADGRQLSQYAGQTVRVSGHTAGQNLFVPDRVEVRQSGGDFREVTFSKPLDSGRTGTAQER
jgi:hypothetical protein